MPPATRVVVIGADAAGMSAAHQALRGARVRGRAGEVDHGDRLLARSAGQHR
jgi:predicted flavoprotein YhiN